MFGNPITPTAGNFVSIVNSTAALLGADETFLGTSEDVSRYTTISVSILGTTAAATGTLFFEVSSDEINWSAPQRNITNITKDVPHLFLIAEQFFRLRYTNGSVAQLTSFRIQTIYANGRPMTLAHTIERTITINTDVVLSRVVSNIELDLARRLIEGQRAFFFFGFNSDIDADWEDIHASGGDINWLTTAGKVEVLSSDAADTSAGLGCRSVEIHGLSSTGEDQDEVIALNGTSAVESSLTYIRINKMHNEEVGTYGGSHQGDVTCRVTGGGVVLSVMRGEEGAAGSSVLYGRGEAGNGYYSVPLGKVMYLTRLGVAMNTKTNQTISIVLFERDGLLVTTAPYQPRRVLWEVAEIDEPHTKDFKSHIKIKSLADIWFRAKGSGTNNKIEVSLDFYLLDANASGE